jgi:hypothetical protein
MQHRRKQRPPSHDADAEAGGGVAMRDAATVFVIAVGREPMLRAAAASATKVGGYCYFRRQRLLQTAAAASATKVGDFCYKRP